MKPKDSISRGLIRGLAVALVMALGLGAIVGSGGGGSSTQGVPEPEVSTSTPIAPGAQLIQEMSDVALVGRLYRSKVAIVPNDARNGIASLAISNPTIGGSVPAIDAGGVVTWTPNETDFASTSELNVAATLTSGPVVTVAAAVSVRKERLVHQQQLPNSAGSIADSQGRYLIRVAPTVPGAVMAGTLSISEVFAADGSFAYVVRVPSTSGARVTVVDAPQASDALPISPRSSLRRAPERAVKLGATSPSLAADVGSLIDPSLSGVGSVAGRGEATVYTTRRSSFHYASTAFGYDEVSSAELAYVYQIDANCTTVAECGAIKSSDSAATARGPVILIHGFNPSKSVGGGEGTWGSLASALRARGHPVFELRWITYMRFEEAAGVLSKLAESAAELTGKRVTVIAHSFGGVAAHISMMGQGIQSVGEDWATLPVQGVYQRLITLGAPLSGIRLEPSGTLGLTAGRDDDDRFIGFCDAITCFQAGSSSDYWDSDQIGEMVEKVKAIDSRRIGLTDTREGESVRSLHDAWKVALGHSVPFSTVIGLKRRPNQYVPDLTNDKVFDLGDGLISLMGQSVIPNDFSARPFDAEKKFDVLGTLGADFTGRLDKRHAADMERIVQFGREYFFAMHATHSSPQNLVGFSYTIANYPADGLVDIAGESPADHPLHYFIFSDQHLAETALPYAARPSPAKSTVQAVLTRGGQPLGAQLVAFRVELAAAGSPVIDTLYQMSDSTGAVTFDAGQALSDRYPGVSLNLAEFNVRITTGTGLLTARVSIRQGLAAEVNLGNIDLTPPGAADLVTAAGRVIDGQTEAQALSSVQLYLMKGVRQSVEILPLVADTATSRKLVTNSTGDFVIAGLEPGEYSVLAVKPNYVSQTQGVVKIGPGFTSGLSFSMLRVLAPNQATITLRWLANGGDLRVSSDLDAHLRKYNFAGYEEYYLNYSNRLGTGGDQLDRDDRTYQGPETVSITLDTTAQYVYWVGNFFYANGVSMIATSQPSVLVRIGNATREFSLPAGLVSTKQYWQVFTIVNGVIVPCGACLQDGGSTPLPGK